LSTHGGTCLKHVRPNVFHAAIVELALEWEHGQMQKHKAAKKASI